MVDLLSHGVPAVASCNSQKPLTIQALNRLAAFLQQYGNRNLQAVITQRQSA